MSAEQRERREDMSPEGKLQLTVQADGDIIVTCYQPDRNGAYDAVASVEFCTSGGRSPHVMRALRELWKAIGRDNAGDPMPPLLPDVPVIAGAYPVVLYLATKAERREFIDTIRQINPNLQPHPLQ